MSSLSYNGRNDYTAAEHAINSALDTWYQEGNYSEASDALGLIANIKGYQVATGTSTGYCQGDAIEYIIGIPNTPADPIGETYAQGVQDEYAAWAFGDGYGYVIEELVDKEWIETEHSCWGFYGDLSGSYPEYMVEDARASAAYHDEQITKRETREQFETMRDAMKNRKRKHGRVLVKRANTLRFA